MVKGQLHGIHSGGGSPFSKNSCVRRECPIRHLLKMPMYFAADVGAEWYVHLPQDIKTNYGRLTDAFLEEFRPKPAQRWEAENALRARSEKPGEDLRSFIRVVRREGNRIGLTDDQLVPIVMNNLLPNVRALIPGTPATLTAILDTPVGRNASHVGPFPCGPVMWAPRLSTRPLVNHPGLGHEVRATHPVK